MADLTANAIEHENRERSQTNVRDPTLKTTPDSDPTSEEPPEEREEEEGEEEDKPPDPNSLFYLTKTKQKAENGAAEFSKPPALENQINSR